MHLSERGSISTDNKNSLHNAIINMILLISVYINQPLQHDSETRKFFCNFEAVVIKIKTADFRQHLNFKFSLQITIIS